jgi:hypothetical protein
LPHAAKLNGATIINMMLKVYPNFFSVVGSRFHMNPVCTFFVTWLFVVQRSFKFSPAFGTLSRK